MKALDAALTALDDARGHLDQALRAADHDPRELERIEERLFALRAAARKHNVPVDGLNALAARYAADLGLIDAGAERLAALNPPRGRPTRTTARPPPRCRRAAGRRPQNSTGR